MSSAQQIRDQVLPSIWAWQQKVEKPVVLRNIDLAIREDGSIEMVLDGHHQPFLSLQEIEDGSWQGHVEPRMKEIMGELNDGIKAPRSPYPR